MVFKVLLITNREHLRKRFCDLMLEMDLEYQTMTEGEKVLFSMMRFEPHLTIVDMELLDEPGYDTCKRIVTDDSNHKVIAFTTLTTNLIRAQAIRSGARDLLTLPFTDAEFCFTVRKYLEEFNVETS